MTRTQPVETTMSETRFNDEAFWGEPENSCITTTNTTKTPPRGCKNLLPKDSSHLERLTKDPLRMSPPQNSPASPSVTSSQGLADGVKLSSLPASNPPDDCGPGLVLANLSPRQAKERGLLTSATFGLPSSGSSNSADLQQCLASRLRQRLDVNGSPEYALTWKDWPMKWGPPICALRASAHRTSGNGCSGWPTTKANEKAQSPEAHAKGFSSLQDTAQMAGWCSPTCQDGSRGGLPPRPQDTGVPLSQQAALAGWATPDANAMNLGEGLETWDARQIKNKAKHGNGNGAGMPIAVQALTTLPSGAMAGHPTPAASDGNGGKGPRKGVSPTGRMPDGSKVTMGLSASTILIFGGWGTPRVGNNGGHGNPERSADGMSRIEDQVHGAISRSSPAATAKRGALNPALSRWLMGYPVEWCQSALQAFRKLKQQAKRGSPVSRGTATPSSRRSRRSSSSPPKQLGTTALDDFWGETTAPPCPAKAGTWQVLRARGSGSQQVRAAAGLEQPCEPTIGGAAVS